MTATTQSTRPTIVPVAPGAFEPAVAEAVRATTPSAPRRPSHAARRVATAVRGVNGRLMVICPA